jgi:ATP-dependent helicase HrpA
VAPDELRTRLAGLTHRDEHRLERALRRARGQAELERLAAKVAQAEELVARRRAAVPEQIAYPDLPVSARREDLLAAIGEHQVVVVAGETGSGKTTQLPKLCLELGRGVRGTIAHTQPRRLAARTVAERIAEELGVEVGEAVGWSVRFDDRARDDTLIRLMTDGLLLAEVARDPLLRRYDTIIVDEAHERSLNVDFLLGVLHGILPQRPDLKLIITSATIDPGQFAAHFGGAPVVEVSGRTFPVEVRYRPMEDETDEPEAIGEACEELFAEGPGDVLVFLSGEREIRDAAEHLEGRFDGRAEILPLFSRLSTAEQQRVFRPSPPTHRRVVLATNVAETSLTVPGIRYVVDPGFARISRYSPRQKVQRLPIEKISQASADQRKGRCGRVADGICIRLFSEEDFEARPRFTDPEVLRTNLASVVLQLAALDLGPADEFPFLDPPDRKQIRDGVLLLQELGALVGERLTDDGRKLARLPVDPRLARMVLEANRLGCVEEVLVIVAALSIQDVRERPTEERKQADDSHARFAVPGSDFLGLLELWRHLRGRQRELTRSAFRRELKREYLHALRVREWQDLVGQLRAAARETGLTLNTTPGEPDFIHRALLAGLLSQLGLRDRERRDYLGARGTRFALHPSSGLARNGPTWVMVAELVETSRLFGRTAAKVDPAWVEPLAAHLIRREWSSPRWERRKGRVVATERVTLFGLPLVTGRTVPYQHIDPEFSRELFLRKALVERDWDSRHDFLGENRRRLAEIGELEDVARRRDLRVDDEVLLRFFAERVPEGIASAAAFDRWWRKARATQPDLLTLPRELLLRAGSPDPRAGRPAVWEQDGQELQLIYRFEPGTEGDGVTVVVPLRSLARLDPRPFDWLVPALREELVTALLRALPKNLRRELAPISDTAHAVLARCRPGEEGLRQAVAREVGALRGVRVGPEDLDPSVLPAHLRMGFRVVDDRGRIVGEGEDLRELRAKLATKLRDALSAAAQPLEQTGMREWQVAGELPKVVALPGTDAAVRAYPALVDEGRSVGVKVLDTPDAQATSMREGTTRLLRLTVPAPTKRVRDALDSGAQLVLATAPHGSLAGVIDDAMTAAIEVLLDEAGGPAFDEAGFARIRAHVEQHLAARTVEVVRLIVAVLAAVRAVRLKLDLLPDRADLREAREDLAAQLDRLLSPRMAADFGARRLPDVLRYVQAAARRVERLPERVAVDRDRMHAIQALEAEIDGHAELRWQVEELRVAQLAPGAPARPVSAKKIRAALAAEEAAREAVRA